MVLRAHTVALAWLWVEVIEARSFLISELDTQFPSIVVSSVIWFARHSLKLENLSRFSGVPCELTYGTIVFAEAGARDISGYYFLRDAETAYLTLCWGKRQNVLPLHVDNSHPVSEIIFEWRIFVWSTESALLFNFPSGMDEML